jgi:ribonuclease HIII
MYFVHACTSKEFQTLHSYCVFDLAPLCNVFEGECLWASGKRDFFGPLVTAGVIVDPEAVDLLKSLGVDDSKKFTDKKIPGMAEEIRKICYGKYKVLQINPAKYNELYGKMKNLNVLLAWTHAAVIEDLLEKQDVKLAIADKFGDKKYIKTTEEVLL